MAAFENVSKMYAIKRGSRASVVDFRKCRLPDMPQPRETDQFNPRDHREPSQPISVTMAYFNLMRVPFGAGMLALPLAISQIGIVLGPIMCIIIGLTLVHTHRVLLWCLNDISRQLRIPHISYRYGFRLALLNGPTVCRKIGPYGPLIITTFMVLSQVGICSVFVIFTSDSLRDLMDWDNSKPALLSLLIPYLILLFFMKTMRKITYVSMTANVLNVIGLMLVIYLIIDDPHGDPELAKLIPLPTFFAFGLFLFNMSMVGVVLSLDKALPNPELMVKRFGVINIGIIVPTFISATLGALGYWSFGDMEENVLRSLPFDDNISIAAICLYLCAVGFSYPLQCYPGIQIILEVYKNMGEGHTEHSLIVFEYIVRLLFVITTFLVSYMVPFQGPFVAFVGNMCTTLLSMVFPCIMELCLLYSDHEYGPYNVYLYKDLFLILIGIIQWGVGIVLCGYLIYIRLQALLSPNNVEWN